MSRPSRPKAANPPADAQTPETKTDALALVALDPVNTPQVAPDSTGAESASASAAAEAASASVDPHMPTGPGSSPEDAPAPDSTGAESASASAAAEAASASVDPHMPTGPGASPEDAPAPDGTEPSSNAPDADVSTVAAQGFVLRVKGPAKGRWRAGRYFGPEAVDIPVDQLSDEDLQKLYDDPELTCLVLGEF